MVIRSYVLPCLMMLLFFVGLAVNVVSFRCYPDGLVVQSSSFGQYNCAYLSDTAGEVVTACRIVPNIPDLIIRYGAVEPNLASDTF